MIPGEYGPVFGIIKLEGDYRTIFTCFDEWWNYKPDNTSPRLFWEYIGFVYRGKMNKH